MTLLWITLSGIVAGVSGYWLGQRKRVPLDLNRAREAISFRVAVHEAGHAVVGHRAPYIRIHSIEMDEGLGLGRGRVQSMAIRTRQDFAVARWWEAAFSLGGLAAELLETKKARTGNCLEDMTKARGAAHDIVESGDLTPPWTPVPTDTGSFDPCRAFQQGSLPEAEARVLRLAFSQARSILLTEKDSFARVTHALLEHGSLDESAVRKILG